MTHYEVLGIEKNATPAQIKKAYKRMAKKHHPDRGGDAQQMMLVNKAYDTLMDPAKREHYDLTGDEKPLSSIDIEARNSILQLFGGLLDQGKVNIPKRATSINNQAAAKMRGDLAEMQRQLAAIEKRRDEVTCTDPENLWLHLVDSIVDNARGQIAGQERKLEISKRVGEMLLAYRSGVMENVNPTTHTAATGMFDAMKAFQEAKRRSGF